MNVATDLCTQAVDDLIQGLGAGGVHADEELVQAAVHPRRTGLDVRQVDALLLKESQTSGQSSDLLLQREDAGDHFRLLAGLLLQVHGAPSPSLHERGTFQETTCGV